MTIKQASRSPPRTDKSRTSIRLYCRVGQCIQFNKIEYKNNIHAVQNQTKNSPGQFLEYNFSTCQKAHLSELKGGIARFSNTSKQATSFPPRKDKSRTSIRLYCRVFNTCSTEILNILTITTYKFYLNLYLKTCCPFNP